MSATPGGGGPTRPGDRALALDVVRAVALFGVLLVNMEFHRGPAVHLDAGVLPEPGTGPLDDAVAFVIAWLGQGKAYTLLAFLFGYGAHLQLRRARAAGVRFAPRFRRRLLGLLVLGVLHAVLLFFGDILAAYAVTGAFLLLFFARRDRTLLVWAAVLTLLPALLITVASAFAPAVTVAEEDELIASARQAVSGYTGSVGSSIEQRLRDVADSGVLVFASVPSTLALFLVGVWASRRRLLEEAVPDRDRWRRIARWAFGVGLPVNYLSALAFSETPPTGTGFYVAGVLATMLGPLLLAPGYLALAVLAAERLRVLVPLGRLSLTAYLGQSLIAAVIFTAYGLELYGDVGPAAGLLLTLAIFAAEVALARAWLRRHDAGPVERLLRAFTYAGSRSFSAK